MAKNNIHIGSSLNEHLEETNDLSSTNINAIKRVIAWQILQKMKNEKISKAHMAEQIEIDKSDLDCLLDPKDKSLTLQALNSAAQAIGKTLRVKLV